MLMLRIEPFLWEEGKKWLVCIKLHQCPFLQAWVRPSASWASQRAFSPRSNCYLSQSSLLLQLQSSLHLPFFPPSPLSSLPPPAARKHTLITASYLWWRFNNSWPQLSRACAGVARGSFIMTQLISRWNAGGIRGCAEASVGSVNNHNTEIYT